MIAIFLYNLILTLIVPACTHITSPQHYWLLTMCSGHDIGTGILGCLEGVLGGIAATRSDRIGRAQDFHAGN